ncbi:type I DNA topoisomerase [Actinocatenispora rupis]|uniref:DNA topoisomerase 1 n=1 Tax=Actinocatenispora rupis TaxID=519421 RepID=A0A8J3J0S2_9ACTN|nr:type I DNA topoisomerase [Actinocatenispora rupis]GID13691.1 DNA topoisomerase 1 [Actinocatenispora rupis]
MPRSESTTRLVIVESPAKAKTISGYLGPGYVVEASVGHIRDLPKDAKEVPEKYKGTSTAKYGVDIDHDFAPLYVVSPDRKAQVARLKALLKDADELYLATDEDREGEAIAWHLEQLLKPKVPVRRMVFHEITKPAIEAAVSSPREINQSLVDAYEARRILDRLYGYDVSPVLWKKIMPKLSAGRVQSVATRIVVERERQRMAFHAADYWDVQATLAVRAAEAARDAGGQRTFTANLIALDGDRIATGRDFDPATGRVRPNSGVIHLDEQGARGLAARLDGREFTVTRVEEKPYRRRPYAPFMTSTLQQEASRKLRFSSDTTMKVAQRLYENGYITYMRTDSTTLSDTALTAARQQVRELYGDRYVPAEPRQYTRKVKNAQEAHEAIRPSGETFRTPGAVAKQLSADEYKLYELIWRRTIASQMIDAVGNSVSVRVSATSTTNERCDFGASGRTITEPGFLRAYVESTDDETAEAEDAERRLPNLTRDQLLDADRLEASGHTTQPPARYTEASLVKALEELGIGRPSTYASIMQTIQRRGYVFKRGQALVPSFVAFAVVQLLERHFARLVDYDFTAGLEGELDEITAGQVQTLAFLRSFYFGDASGAEGSVAAAGGLKRMATDQLSEIDARGINSIPLFDDDEGRHVVVRVGRYGPYLERRAPGDEDAAPDPDGPRRNVSVPPDTVPDELTPEKVEELFTSNSNARELGTDPATGEPVMLKSGRFGPYVSSGEKNASLFGSQSMETLTLEDALKLLTLPRVVGAAPDGEEITAQNGRYGPYIKKGTDSRSLDAEERIFTITLDEALKLLAEPKQRGRRAAKEPLRTLGDDPVTGKPIVVKDGRFGLYVTDGETNRTLPRSDTVESVTLDRAAELLADKRAQGPAPRKKAAAKKAPAKKATAKKAAAKSTAKKATAKKAATKKTAATKTAAKKAAPKKSTADG